MRYWGVGGRCRHRVGVRLGQGRWEGRERAVLFRAFCSVREVWIYREWADSGCERDLDLIWIWTDLKKG